MAKQTKKQPATVQCIVATNKAHKLQTTANGKSVHGTTPVNARLAWVVAAGQCSGATSAQFVQFVRANPPSTPTSGKYAGVCEPPSGWLSWLKKQGFITLPMLPAAKAATLPTPAAVTKAILAAHTTKAQDKAANK